ncbi:MAG: sigma-70 family RNA polymerase sigma factor [Anaerolineales bacterium]|nr:sigma-70 family RNA polymerase sigma factor [Anaerolineales bacterium]
MEIAQLIERCRQGDALAVESVVRDYEQSVFRLAFSILDDADEAAEATQDAFLSAFDALAEYRGEASFFTWLYSITVNVCRMRLRKRRSHLRLIERLGALLWQERTQSNLPEEKRMQDEEDDFLWDAVRALDEKHRTPLILRYYHNLPVREIARILQTKEGTIHSRLHEARERLRNRLTKRDSDERLDP